MSADRATARSLVACQTALARVVAALAHEPERPATFAEVAEHLERLERIDMLTVEITGALDELGLRLDSHRAVNSETYCDLLDAERERRCDPDWSPGSEALR